MYKSGAWRGFMLWAFVSLPALGLGCSGNGTGGPLDGGADPCVTLEELPAEPSPITWSGTPACDGAGFCVVHPAPMNGITSVAASPSGTNWAIHQNVVASWKGTQGKVTRFDIDDNADIEDIFALSDSDVWIVGSGSRVVHYDGTRWTAGMVPSGTALSAVWASGPSDVWAVGNFGVISHYDGASWSSSEPAGSGSGFTSVFGTGSRDVWAVGGNDVLHYDGTRWTKINIGTTKLIDAGWSAAPNDVFLVGQGTVLRGSIAGGFTQQTLPATEANTGFRFVWGSSANDVWVSSDFRAMHWDGTSWKVVADLAGIIRGRSASDVVAVDGTQARTFDGSSWKTAFSLKDPTLRAAWAASADDVWSVGADGFVVRVKNGVVSRARLKTEDLAAVWGTSPGDIMILDRDRTLYRGDGKNFCATVLPTSDLTYNAEISGTGPSDIWVTTGSTMLHYDGQSWRVTGSLSAEHVFAPAARDAWAAGEALHRWDGSRWNLVIASTGFASSFGPIWGTSSSDVWTSQDVFLGGDYSLHWTGTGFTKIADDGQTRGTLSGSASNDIWSFGFYHQHWDGTKWNYVQTPRLGIEASVATSRDVWAFGEKGLVLRKSK